MYIYIPSSSSSLYIWNQGSIVTWYIGNWELGSKYIGNWKIRVYIHIYMYICIYIHTILWILWVPRLPPCPRCWTRPSLAFHRVRTVVPSESLGEPVVRHVVDGCDRFPPVGHPKKVVKSKAISDPQKWPKHSGLGIILICPDVVDGCDIFWIYPPPRMPVTTRIIPFLVGNPYKPSFVTVTGCGVDQRCIISNTIKLWFRNIIL